MTQAVEGPPGPARALQSLRLAERMGEARKALQDVWEGLEAETIGAEAFTAMEGAGWVHGFCLQSLGTESILKTMEAFLRRAAAEGGA